MKFLGKLFLVGLLSLSSLYGSELHKLFSLQDQEFADVTSKKLQKYKVNSNMILSMKLSKVDTFDGYQGLSKNIDYDNKSFFKLTFIKPSLKNWVYTENIALDMGNSYFYREEQPATLSFNDVNGISSMLSIKNGKICTGDRCLNNPGKKSYISYKIKVVFVNNTLTYYVNDQKLYSSKKRFNKLKSIDHTLFTYTSKDISDTLINFTLSEIK